MIPLKCSCGHKLQIRDEMAGKKVRCPGCEKVLRVPEEDIPYAESTSEESVDTDYQESSVLKALYIFALILGLVMAGYIYLIAFNQLSETVLVQITPLWFFPIIFGFYGLVSQHLIRYIVEGKAATLTEAAKVLIGAIGHWALIGMFPFLFLKWRNSFLVTLVASLFWGLLLSIFFVAIFPKL